MSIEVVVVVRLRSWLVSVYVSRLEIAEFPWRPLVCSIDRLPDRDVPFPTR